MLEFILRSKFSGDEQNKSIYTIHRKGNKHKIFGLNYSSIKISCLIKLKHLFPFLYFSLTLVFTISISDQCLRSMTNNVNQCQQCICP